MLIGGQFVCRDQETAHGGGTPGPPVSCYRSAAAKTSNTSMIPHFRPLCKGRAISSYDRWRSYTKGASLGHSQRYPCGTAVTNGRLAPCSSIRLRDGSVLGIP